MTTETKLSKIPEELLGSLKEGVQSILDDKDWAGFLNMMRKIHHYSFNNRFLIALEQQKRGYGVSPLVAGFKKWKSEFKRTVKKGEKSIHIMAPVMYTVTDESGNLRKIGMSEFQYIVRDYKRIVSEIITKKESMKAGREGIADFALERMQEEGLFDDLIGAQFDDLLFRFNKKADPSKHKQFIDEVYSELLPHIRRYKPEEKNESR